MLAKIISLEEYKPQDHYHEEAFNQTPILSLTSFLGTLSAFLQHQGKQPVFPCHAGGAEKKQQRRLGNEIPYASATHFLSYGKQARETSKPPNRLKTNALYLLFTTKISISAIARSSWLCMQYLCATPFMPKGSSMSPISSPFATQPCSWEPWLTFATLMASWKSLQRGLADVHGRIQARSGTLFLFIWQLWHNGQALHRHWIILRPFALLLPSNVLHCLAIKSNSQESVISQPPFSSPWSDFAARVQALQGEDARLFWNSIINKESEVEDLQLMDTRVVRYSLKNQLLIHRLVNDGAWFIYI